MKNFSNEREFSIPNPFGSVSAEAVAATRWSMYGKTVHEVAVDIITDYLIGTTEAFRRTGVITNWNDYVEASQRGSIYLPTNPSWKRKSL